MDLWVFVLYRENTCLPVLWPGPLGTLAMMLLWSGVMVSLLQSGAYEGDGVPLLGLDPQILPECPRHPAWLQECLSSESSPPFTKCN